MTTVLNGLLGGLLAGAAAAVVTRAVADGPAATAAVLERTLGPGASSSRWVGFVAQILYGGLAGGGLLALELSVLGVLAVPPTTVDSDCDESFRDRPPTYGLTGTQSSQSL